MNQRHIRHTELDGFGEIGLERLKKSSVVIIGVGGVGGALLPILVSSGVGRVRFIDFDNVSESNLNRQFLYTESDIGFAKADVAFARLKALNSEVNLESINAKLTAENAKDFLKSFDLCVIATDSFLSKIFLSDICSELGIRHIVASAEGWLAQNIFLKDSGLRNFICDNTVVNEKSKGSAVLGAVANMSGVMIGAMLVKIIAKGLCENYPADTIISADFKESFDFNVRKISL